MPFHLLASPTNIHGSVGQLRSPGRTVDVTIGFRNVSNSRDSYLHASFGGARCVPPGVVDQGLSLNGIHPLLTSSVMSWISSVVLLPSHGQLFHQLFPPQKSSGLDLRELQSRHCPLSRTDCPKTGTLSSSGTRVQFPGRTIVFRISPSHIVRHSSKDPPSPHTVRQTDRGAVPIENTARDSLAADMRIYFNAWPQSLSSCT